MKLFNRKPHIDNKYFNEEPLRLQLFSAEQMVKHAKMLAQQHALAKRKVGDVLLPRLADNEKKLLLVREQLKQTVKEGHEVTPAGEWLLDNFYLIEEQIQLAKKHLPKGYSEGLPQLEEAAVPRVYDIALEVIQHSDGRLDMDILNVFLRAYQSGTELKIGELWAIPIMLRLALLENLRRVAVRISEDREYRDLADRWAKQMIATVDKEPAKLILVLADMARSNPPLRRPFVAEFTRQLRGRGPTLQQVLNWIEDRLNEEGHTSIEMVQGENQKLATDQLSISNSINSLRLLNNIDWADFVEDNSLVEAILRKDPLYPLLNFSTRDQYRHVVEGVSKHSKHTEVEIANLVLHFAQDSQVNGQSTRKGHIGYYLIDEGVQLTEQNSGMHFSLIDKLRKNVLRMPLVAYLLPIVLITAAVTYGFVYKVTYDMHSLGLSIGIGIVAAICASQLAVSLVNFFSTLLVKPTQLPRMDYSKRIPDSAKTAVAIPTMLLNLAEVDTLVEALEIRYLANKQSNLFFCLLTDLRDADKEHLDEDDELVGLATERIKELNVKYANGGPDIFFLLHRPRLWNQGEGVWMAYERKRGKLAALNALLRGSTSAFSHIVGNIELLQDVRYVLTLDSDTQLPRDAAWKIIATMAHPLNKPVYDEGKGIVTKGYGLLQPRVGVSMPRADSSQYAKLNGNEPGIDPYTRATSDVYQDLFKEGSFIGKGIYDVDVFEKALNNRFPENRILSHDLLEGNYIRSGLISDVQLYEKYPSRYSADIKRRHRWIRGDWQIAAWFTPWVPDANNKWHGNPLSGLGRWKIFDNIRRSLFPIAVTLMIMLDWLLLPQPGWWTLIVSSLLILPAVVSVVWNVIRKPKDMVLSHHIIVASRSAGATAISTLFTVICLPYEAFVNLDAILRTTWRMLISRRHLLEWNPSGVTDRLSANTLSTYYITMWFEPVLAMGALVFLGITHGKVLESAAPILALWLAAPFITWFVSRPLPVKAAQLSLQQKIFLEKTSRRIWAFFEDLVNEKENWLPPDNLQEIPVETIAHRTSPTNIGMAMLSTLSAHDFGYINTEVLLQRLENTFGTLNKMERSRGHLYNWYDTQTLQPLPPRYISTVDSGNFAGHLLTLRQGLLDVSHRALVCNSFFQGLRTTLRLLADSAGKTNIPTIKKFKTELETVINNYPKDIVEMYQCVQQIADSYSNVYNSLMLPQHNNAEYWKNALKKQIIGAQQELETYVPWANDATFVAQHRECIASFGVVSLANLILLNEQLEKNNGRIKEDCADDPALNSTAVTVVQQSNQHIKERIERIEALSKLCFEFADVEWDFLYNKTKQLLTIGHNVDDNRNDNSYYDLLASEARLGIFVAISMGKIPQESWFSLGRHLLNIDDNPVLLSWSGSMFEYLMPTLVMPTYDNTLLAQTEKSSVQRQINYGKHTEMPWGISESGYNMIDTAQNYQYHAFGVPGLGLKRGLGEDLVIAPYAAVMALMVEPEKACQNLLNMSNLGFMGRYGFYEAVDYTPSRLQRNQPFALIESFMAHHQGMSMLSIAYVLLGQRMQKRFESEPALNASLLLLEEKIPKTSSFYAHTGDVADVHVTASETDIRIIHTPDTAVPEIQLLGNENYKVMVTAAGGGYSKWRGYALTRWREDTTCDNWGMFCYIRDTDSGAFWSNTHQPVTRKGTNFEVAFSQGRADFRDKFDGLEVHTEIVVSPEDDIEMRRVHITNRSGKRRNLDVTSYSEVVIAPASADNAHPAFSNLFVETELLTDSNAILCSRRPRTEGEKPPLMFHLMKMHGKQATQTSYETNRMNFTGRTNTLKSPSAMRQKGALSNTQGAVLDPIVSIRYEFSLAVEETIVFDVLLGAAETRDKCVQMVAKYQDKNHKDRVFDLAWTHSQIVLHQIKATEAEAQLYTRLAGSIIYLNPAMRAEGSVLARNTKGQAGLWPYSISGDLPIVFARIEDHTNIEFIKQLIQAHSYWRMKGLPVDLVIWNETYSGYRQDVENRITEIVGGQLNQKNGGVFIRSGDQISAEDRVLLQTVARISINGHDGTLLDFINKKKSGNKTAIPYLSPTVQVKPSYDVPALQSRVVQFDNTYGGFNADGKEYVINASKANVTPTPWSNVLANENFGTVISENGQSYTWFENAHEFRISPWSNDPVSDLGGEMIYIRDEETGYYWSPMTALKQDAGQYQVRHGFGYSVIEHIDAGIHTEVWIYVDTEAGIKFNLLNIKNLSNRARKLTVTGYAELVLGDLQAKHAMFIHTELDSETGALLSKNSYSQEFADRFTFFDTDEVNKVYTFDRTEFIGRNRNLHNPEAMQREKLSGKRSIGTDPCVALQSQINIGAGKEYQVVYKLGAGKNYGEAKETIKRFKGKDVAVQTLDKVRKYWADVTGAIQVETPDNALNIMANGWLLYQTLACRMWARSGFYQSGGAYGFRDQLQDSMAMLYTKPELTRKQILLAASKQFVEGDAMHWWHPPVNRGVRTKCSDDFLWLPFVTARYLSVTGDDSIMQEQVRFIEGRQLGPDEESNYDLPNQSNQVASIYEHCLRAIKHGLRLGEHGLPLIGTGDWNDGMDQVGKHGKGESVWLAFFVYDILNSFIRIAESRDDVATAAMCIAESEKLKDNIDKHAWDGKWYRRAYFDDGTPLGSESNDECKIDAIAQSWSVISGAGDEEKRKQALESAYELLVDKEHRILKLLTPPFNSSDLQPGYIKGYLPGIRENGGQYTHAAIWLVMAFAMQQDAERAYELLRYVNPLLHGNTKQEADKYRGEPYVMAGDVYEGEHPGQAGWTWYTGSAGWAYRLIIEYILGMKMENGEVSFSPRVPVAWDSFKVSYTLNEELKQFVYERKVDKLLPNK